MLQKQPYCVIGLLRRCLHKEFDNFTPETLVFNFENDANITGIEVYEFSPLQKYWDTDGNQFLSAVD